VTLTVFVADGCPHCASLLTDLRRRNVPFHCVNLSREPQRVAEVAALTWERRVPVVVDHERCSVGFSGGSTPFEELGIAAPPAGATAG
jgi:glutaredoxin